MAAILNKFSKEDANQMLQFPRGILPDNCILGQSSDTSTTEFYVFIRLESNIPQGREMILSGMDTNTENKNLEQEERPLFSKEGIAQTIPDVKQIHKSKLRTNDKLEEIRRRYLKKISEQPEGYRQQLVANLRDKREISPELQEQLALEWGLKSASDI